MCAKVTAPFTGLRKVLGVQTMEKYTNDLHLPTNLGTCHNSHRPLTEETSSESLSHDLPVTLKLHTIY